jgi:hypothetical protein
MTTDLGLQISLAIVGRSETKADRGTPQSLIADGQWHLYEWNLDQSQMWQVSFQETGVISDPEFTLDSIQIFGSPSSATVFLDDIFHEIRPRDSANAYQSLRD